MYIFKRTQGVIAGGPLEGPRTRALGKTICRGRSIDGRHDRGRFTWGAERRDWSRGDQGNTTAPRQVRSTSSRVGKRLTQSAYVKPAFTTAYALFGAAVAIREHDRGRRALECGAVTGVNGDATPSPCIFTGGRTSSPELGVIVRRPMWEGIVPPMTTIASGARSRSATPWSSALPTSRAAAPTTDASTANAGAVCVFGPLRQLDAARVREGTERVREELLRKHPRSKATPLAVAGYRATEMTAYVVARTGIDWQVRRAGSPELPPADRPCRVPSRCPETRC